MTAVAKIQLRLIGLALGMVGVLLLASGVIQYTRVQQNHRLQHRNDAQVQFWRSIAGYTHSGDSVDDRLAQDLRGILDDPEAIQNFNGSPDLYGGIIDAIGYDPFSGANCSECGPLRGDVKDNLDLIRQGKINQVVTQTKVNYNTSYTFTLFGVSWLMQIVFLYLFLGPLTFYGAYVIADQDPDLNLQMFLSVPFMYLWEKFSSHRSGKKDDSEARRQFPEYCDLLDNVDEAISELPHGPERQTLIDQRNEVRVELLRQVHSSHNAKSQDEMRELANALDTLSTTLKARSEARKNLDEW